MPKTNCFNCGVEYKVCADAVKINSWHRRFCSPNCFQEYTARCEAANAILNQSTIEPVVQDYIPIQDCLLENTETEEIN